MSERLAVFDVDGTIFKSACVEKVVDEAIRQDIFDEEAFREARARRTAWQQNNNEGVYQSYLHNLVGGFVASVAGVEVERFDQVIKATAVRHKVRRFAYAQNLARVLQWSHSSVAISGSPQPIIEEFLDDIPFAQVIGSSFEVKDGKYTGAAQATDKANVLANHFPGQEIAVGIGDTVGDIPVLEAAACPIAFNPSATLRRRAIKSGWYIVTEHKDAITQLLPHDGDYQPVFDRDPHIILEAAGVSYV